MLILVPLGMYFDAAMVFVKTFFTFIQIGSGHTVRQSSSSRQAVVRQSSGSHQAVFRYLSGSRQAVVEQYLVIK